MVCFEPSRARGKMNVHVVIKMEKTIHSVLMFSESH